MTWMFPLVEVGLHVVQVDSCGWLALEDLSGTCVGDCLLVVGSFIRGSTSIESLALVQTASELSKTLHSSNDLVDRFTAYIESLDRLDQSDPPSHDEEEIDSGIDPTSDDEQELKSDITLAVPSSRTPDVGDEEEKVKTAMTRISANNCGKDSYWLSHGLVKWVISSTVQYFIRTLFPFS
ncbi:hypothetical protein BJ742DRAFT_864925 [Cladochytrium replicatum]|nr:hypothetical protein BJ742DRAFT_864925 [Cladochytrium replicatum]